MNLEGRVALITGGRRIGRAVARDLAAHGADVAVSYRASRQEAEATASDVVALGRRVAAIAADVADPAQCAELITAVTTTLGRLDILINMASIYESVPLAATTSAHWQRHFDINARSAFLCAQAAAPHMRAHGGGRIINFADWLPASGRTAYEGFVAYYASKGAVIALTEALALELARDRILVNAIAPGPIVAPPDLDERELAEVTSATPLGRWGGEIEIAKAVRMLVDSDFITGETIRVDGGRHLR